MDDEAEVDGDGTGSEAECTCVLEIVVVLMLINNEIQGKPKLRVPIDFSMNHTDNKPVSAAANQFHDQLCWNETFRPVLLPSSCWYCILVCLDAQHYGTIDEA
ncbi:hypothetical protein AC578_4459 [Pseudocercospora eumusae]|uniref:Uncharacterized protein n=1 Tax=Pseudocercospora eumusae TaxID=321146 RepID=A0A139HF31_9PEZI|nr:hypothetical protein AC578_4459 [Pseudocercospora eumusae]